ncbi:unnamed protein product [Dicrocoelium dendriticum]|nr:unnamed protein product [Dicrocoelium dendriticum]
MSVACYHLSLAWAPLLLALTISSTMLICYLVAVVKGSVLAEFPMISATGAFPPESCIFSQGLNLASFFSLLCVYLWHRIAHEQTKYMGTKQPKCVLYWSLVVGALASLGLSLVGNFQMVNVVAVHDVGAIMAFGGCTIYIFMTTHICRRYLGYRAIYWVLRLLLALGCLVSSLIFLGCRITYHTLYHTDSFALLTRVLPTDPGYTEFICSASAEWVLALCIIMYFLSLAPEFRKYALQMPQAVGSSMWNQSSK